MKENACLWTGNRNCDRWFPVLFKGFGAPRAPYVNVTPLVTHHLRVQKQPCSQGDAVLISGIGRRDSRYQKWVCLE